MVKPLVEPSVEQQSEEPSVRQQPESGARPRRFGKRAVALASYAVVFLVWWRTMGLPSDIIAALVAGWILVICWRIDRPFREHLIFVRDWIPLAILISAYDISRGHAWQGSKPHVTEMIHFDKWLFHGEVPTVWMQEHLYHPPTVYVWDMITSWTYYSHFVAAPIVAVVLWLKVRDQWGRFIRRWIMLSALGLFTYFTYPAAPPWWASEHGLIPHVQRISGRGWDILGLHTGAHLVELAGDLSNPVAAMPSLHAGFSMLVVAFFLPRVRRRWWPLLLAYPVTMGAALVYSGEHWVTDVLVGWLYVGFIFLTMGLAERIVARWRASRTLPPLPGQNAAETASAEAEAASDPAQPDRKKADERIGALH